MNLQELSQSMSGKTIVWKDHSPKRKVEVQVMSNIAVKKVFVRMTHFVYTDERGYGHVLCLTKETIEKLAACGQWCKSFEDGSVRTLSLVANVSP